MIGQRSFRTPLNQRLLCKKDETLDHFLLDCEQPRDIRNPILDDYCDEGVGWGGVRVGGGGGGGGGPFSARNKSIHFLLIHYL